MYGVSPVKIPPKCWGLSNLLYTLPFIHLDNSPLKNFLYINYSQFVFHQDRTKSPWFVRIYEAPAFLPIAKKKRYGFPFKSVGAVLQGVFFFWTPPKKLEYKIPLYPLALREMSEQLT